MKVIVDGIAVVNVDSIVVIPDLTIVTIITCGYDTNYPYNDSRNSV